MFKFGEDSVLVTLYFRHCFGKILFEGDCFGKTLFWGTVFGEILFWGDFISLHLYKFVQEGQNVETIYVSTVSMQYYTIVYNTNYTVQYYIHYNCTILILWYSFKSEEGTLHTRPDDGTSTGLSNSERRTYSR